MALKSASRGAQRLQLAEFIASYNDTGKDAVTGATKGFGTTIAENLVMDAILLPLGAVLVGGELIVETQGVGPTAYTVAISAATTGTALLAATSLLAASGTRTAFTALGFAQTNAGENIRITMASTVAAATAGKFRVRVWYSIDGKVDEVVTN